MEESGSSTGILSGYLSLIRAASACLFSARHKEQSIFYLNTDYHVFPIIILSNTQKKQTKTIIVCYNQRLCTHTLIQKTDMAFICKIKWIWHLFSSNYMKQRLILYMRIGETKYNLQHAFKSISMRKAIEIDETW